jgi:hypothetical protein
MEETSSYEMGPASAVPDLSGKNFDDAVEAIVDWFCSNFEDPCHHTMRNDGEYVFLWGDPQSARDELEVAFPSVDEKLIDAAVGCIEEDGGFDWVPAQCRMIEEAPAKGSTRIAPLYVSEDEDLRWRHEMHDKLSEYRRERRDARGPDHPPPDLEVRCYDVVNKIELKSDQTFAEILPAIIAERHALSATARRVLLQAVREAAKKRRKAADKAEARARQYEGWAVQLDDPKQVV